MSYCRLCRQKTPCACTPYNAIRERGEPGPQGDNAQIPTFTATLTEGAPNVLIGGTLLAVEVEFFQPTPDTSLDYVWLGINTFTGGFITNGSLTVEVGDGVDEGLYLPGSTVTTTLFVTGSTQLYGNILFNGVTYTVDNLNSTGSAYLLGPTTIPNLTITGPLTISGGGTLPAISLHDIEAYQRYFITGSTRIAVEALLDECGHLRSGNHGVITEPLQMDGGADTLLAVPADADEHDLFFMGIAVGPPACGSSQTAIIDVLAFVQLGAFITGSGARWTIRMRAGSYAGPILDEFSYSPQTGANCPFPDMPLPMRNTNVSIATGENGIYFTAQADEFAASNLHVFPSQSTLIVK